MKLHPLWQEYPTLQSELTETLALMEQTVKLKNKPVEKAVLEMIHAGGKLLRPAYHKKPSPWPLPSRCSTRRP